jgi:D-sedoheptulose 7-phosphate isomerase
MEISSNHSNALISKYFAKLNSALSLINLKEMELLYSALLEVRKNRSNLFIAGNGGSASTAQHFSIDLGVGGLSRNSIIRAVSLSDNQSAVTAISNDFNYKYVYSSQLSLFGNFGDLLLVISASGNSENLIEAVSTAKSMGIQTFGMLGFDGGALRSLCDQSILVNTQKGDYGIVEDVHLSICHNLTEALRSTPN